MCIICGPRPGVGLEPANPCLCGAPGSLRAMRRIEADLSRRQLPGGARAVLAMFAGFGLGPRDAAEQAPRRSLLLTDLRLFDGETRAMQVGRDILIDDGRIAALPPPGQGPAEAERLSCGGRAVIPGLTGCHWHASLVGVSMTTALTADISFIHLVAGREAAACLLRGFTTVRDVGGPAFGLRIAIDRGVIPLPRIFPAGAMISQTSGHGDFRLRSDPPRMPGSPAGHGERQGVNAIADDADDVLRRARGQPMRGASQVKIHASGGVSSLHDPLDTAQFTSRETRAAFVAAEDWRTCVCGHANHPARDPPLQRTHGLRHRHPDEPRRLGGAGAAACQVRALHAAARCAAHGHRRGRRAACAVGAAGALSRAARRDRGGRDGRPAGDRRRPGAEARLARHARDLARADHEGRPRRAVHALR